MRLTLGLTGLLPLFEPRLYSATQVTRGKPAPDLFLFAARSMAMAPERAVVVEDSVPGVCGAVAAGMRVLGFAREGNPDELRDAGAEVFFHMDELPTLLSGARLSY
jgi:beta-phosphoglucomutase-like phosphatase (HAD superfamily)